MLLNSIFTSIEQFILFSLNIIIKNYCTLSLIPVHFVTTDNYILTGQKAKGNPVYRKGPKLQTKKQNVEKQPGIKKENKENDEPENLEDFNKDKSELLHKENTTSSVCPSCGMVLEKYHIIPTKYFN